MKKWILFLILLWLYGCYVAPAPAPYASVLKYNPTELSKVNIGKTSKTDIYKAFGTPTTKTIFSSGIEQWKYFYNKQGDYAQFRRLGNVGIMERLISFNFDKNGILIDYSNEWPTSGIGGD